MIEGDFHHQGTTRIDWGYFSYIPDRRLLLRDADTVQIVLPFNEAVVLETLLTCPNQRVDYARLEGIIKKEQSRMFFIFAPLVNSLRAKIGDVNFGQDPLDRRYGIWRYINNWMDRPEGTSNGNEHSGLILKNRNIDQVKEIYKKNPPHPFNADRVFIEL